MSSYQHPTKKWLSSFGRRHGRKLTTERQKQMGEGLPAYAVTLGEHQAVDLSALLGKKQAYHLEIGFGAGEHLAALAQRYPEIGFLGCEPFINGVAKLVSIIEERQITNIRIHADDARLLIEQLPDASIAKIYILFPDPWPKQRHHKRRIVSSEMLAMLARIQPSGGIVQLATDHVDYGAWMLEKLLAHPDYEWLAQSQQDWMQPPADWVETRYQQKTTREGRVPLFITARRR